MIMRDYRSRDYEINCDSCSECLDLKVTDFFEAVAVAKANEWRFKKDDDNNWIHTCGYCQ